MAAEAIVRAKIVLDPKSLICVKAYPLVSIEAHLHRARDAIHHQRVDPVGVNNVDN